MIELDSADSSMIKLNQEDLSKFELDQVRLVGFK